MTTHCHAPRFVKIRLAIPIGSLAVGIASFDLRAMVNAKPPTKDRVEAAIRLDVLAAPNPTADVVGHVNPGAAIIIERQTTGSMINRSHILDKTSGGYVPDHWVSTQG